MRYLSIDYGLRRLGLAFCDPSEAYVSSLCQLQNDRSHCENVIRKILAIIEENQIEAIVVGLPLNMDDSEGGQAKLTRAFAQKLSLATPIPIHMQDERLSSAAADEILAESELTNKQKKARRDMIAAAEILREYLRVKSPHDTL